MRALALRSLIARIAWLAATLPGIVPACGKVSNLSNQAGLTANYVPVTFAGKPLLPATVNVPYKEILQVYNGLAPFQFTLTQGELPTGVTMEPTTGIIEGTVPVSALGKTFAFSAAVTDANSVSANQSFSVNAIADTSYKAVSIADQTLAPISVGASYQYTVLVDNGEPPYTFTVSNGTLPTGLTLAPSTGVISGSVAESANMPTQTSLAITVSDAYGSTDVKSFTMTLAPYAITMVPLSLQSVTPGQAYSTQFTALDGAPPVKYSLYGSLPPNMTFSLSGALTASSPYVPLGNASSTWPIEVTATDVNGVTTTANYTLSVGSAPSGTANLAIQNTTLPTMTAGTAYSGGINTTGGVAPLHYAVNSGVLPTGITLNTSTGAITGTLGFNTAGNAYAAVVEVTDSAGATASQTYSGVVSAGSSTLTIVSSIVSNPIAGAPYSSVVAVSGGLAPYTFSVTSGSLPTGLSLSTSTGNITGTAATTLGGSTFLFTVTVNDSAGQSANKTFSGTVGSVTSALAIATTSLPSPLAGSAYSAGITVTGGTQPFTYSIISGALPTGLSLNTSTGVISGTLAYSSAGSSFAVNLEVQDANHTIATQTYTGAVTNGATTLAISSTSLTTPTAGTPYSGVVAATGGVTPYSFAITAGALPTGLSLNTANGTITGTPAYATASTSYSITVAVSDTSGQSASRAFSGTIGAISPALAIQNSTLVAPQAGSGYSAGISVVGGVPPLSYSVSSGSLPSGLSLSTSTGVMSGTVPYSAAATSYAVTITVSDSVGESASQSYTGTVGNGATTLAIGTTSLSTPTAGTPYGGVISVTGGVTPYAFSITAGALPTGLSLSTSNGAITGTPAYSTASTSYSFTVSVSDSSNQTVTKAYSGSVAAISPAMSIQTTSLITPAAGAAYSTGIAVSGGVGTLTYQLQSGALPSGLSLSSGVISGTVPYSAAGSGYVAVIKVSDQGGQTATQTYSGTVANGASTLAIGSSSLTTPLAGTPYAAVVPVTGGVPSYNFSVSSGSLPSGLSLATSSGVISGTPAYATAGSTYTFAVSVSDQSTQTATKTYSGTIGSGFSTFSIQTSSLPTFTAGAGYLASINVTGGVTPYQAPSVTAGTLPLGISLSASGQLSGTVAMSARTTPYTFTVTETDNASHSASQTYSGTVSDYVLALVPSTLASATPGTAYTTTISTTGGGTPYTYSMASGTMPSGVSFSNGQFSGVVADSEAGVTRNFSIKSVDVNGASVTQPYTLTTSSFTVTLTTSALGNAIEGATYTDGGTTLSASGGTSPYTYSYTGSLPSGIGLSSAGSFFGTPAAGTGSIAGTNYPISITVTDAAGRISNAYSLTLTVKVSVPTVTTTSLAAGVLGTTYTAVLSGSGGRPPYTFSLASGSLPTGLAFAAVGSGTIQGTPTGSTTCPASAFSVTVTDALSQTSTSASECITTVNGINISNTSFPAVIIGTNYSSKVTLVGGTAPFTYAQSGLPTGLAIGSSSGSITGYTNAAVGDYTSYITVTDSSTPTTLSATAAYTFHVRNPVSLASATLPRAGTGIAYTSTNLSGSGGLTPYTYSISAGSLPPGLTLASGTISGTPAYNAAVNSPYNFTVSIADSSGNGTTQSYTINASVAPTITTLALNPGVVGVPYQTFLSRVGGANPWPGSGTASQLTWSATGLPAGLSINSSSGVISGTPTTATGSPFSVTVSLSDAYGMSTSQTYSLSVATKGKTLDLGSAHFSEVCPTGVLCDPRAYAISAITGTSQQYAIYSNNNTHTIQISMIDSTGRVPMPGSGSNFTENIVPTGVTGPISAVAVADIDQDGKLDIVFVDNGSKQVFVLWNQGTVNSYGMPTGFSSSYQTAYSVPVGGNAANAAYAMKVMSTLRPDATNNGKQDLIITDSSQVNTQAGSIVVMLNTCASGGNCTASRSTLLQATALTPTATTTSGSNVLTAVSSVTGVVVGQPISTANLPANTYITAFTSNTITVSANATASGAAQSLSITPNQIIVTPSLVNAASTSMYDIYNVGVGYFNTQSGTGICPSIVLGGTQNTNTNGDWLYIVHQSYTSSQCQGDFATTIETTGNVTNASTSITGVASTTGVVAGQPISGTGIPAGAYVMSFTGNTITISAAATATNSGVSLIMTSSHNYYDEKEVSVNNGLIDAIAVTDYNNDGISDIAVGLGNNNQTNSASVDVYLMQGGTNTFPTTPLQPLLQTLNGVNVGAAKILPYCQNGATSCTYPSLLVICNRELTYGNSGSNGCLSILPNLYNTGYPGTAAFENNADVYRIDYAAPPSVNREPVAVPLVSTSTISITGNTTNGNGTITSVSSTSGLVTGQAVSGSGIPAGAYITAVGATTLTVSPTPTATASTVALSIPALPTLNDVALLGADQTYNGVTTPYFLTYARNSSGTTIPFKAPLMLNGFPASYLEPAEIGTMKLVTINGQLGLITFLVNQSAVSVYLNDLNSTTYSGLPDPVFNPMAVDQGYPTGWHMQNTMDIADLNNDGIPDVVAIGYYSRGVSVALGNNNGIIDAPVLYDIGTSGDNKPQGVAIADLDQDGIPDIVVVGIDTTGVQTGYVAWLKGNGDGTFQPAQQLTGLTSACTDLRAVATPDLDGDGRPELAILCYNTQQIWIARRHTNGTWVAQTGGTINTGGGNNGTAMAWGHLTSSSGYDLALGGLDVNNSLRIITGISLNVTPATGAFTVNSSLGAYQSLNGYLADIGLADLNVDGYGDLLVTMQAQNGQGNQNGEVYYSCQSTGAGTCTTKGWGMEGYQTTSIALGDVNGDGLPDAMIGFRANANTVQRLIYRTMSRVLNTSY